MRLTTALKVMAIMSGRYDTKDQYEVKGTDQHGNPRTEVINGVDIDRLERDIRLTIGDGDKE